jgi:hypothetical protein
MSTAMVTCQMVHLNLASANDQKADIQKLIFYAEVAVCLNSEIYYGNEFTWRLTRTARQRADRRVVTSRHKSVPRT